MHPFPLLEKIYIFLLILNIFNKFFVFLYFSSFASINSCNSKVVYVFLGGKKLISVFGIACSKLALIFFSIISRTNPQMLPQSQFYWHSINLNWFPVIWFSFTIANLLSFINFFLVPISFNCLLDKSEEEFFYLLSFVLLPRD